MRISSLATARVSWVNHNMFRKGCNYAKIHQVAAEVSVMRKSSRTDTVLGDDAVALPTATYEMTYT